MQKKCQAEMLSTNKRDLMLLGVKANGAVKGRLLVMTLEQRYRNTSSDNTEIMYTFPIPFGAVLMEVEVELNGKLLKGEVSARSTARAQYEQAISEGNTSIMLEKNHDGSFTLELGNLMAREECRIMVRYAQVLQTEHGQVRLMLPTTIAPRYGNPITQGRKQPHQVPVTDLVAEYPFDISVTLMGDMANTNVSCLSHKTSYMRNKDDLIIQLSQRGYLDRDFILVISNLKSDSEALASDDLYQEGQTAVMAFFSPQFNASTSRPLTAKVLVDCSGSMQGDSIHAAKNALKAIIRGMGPEDRFSLSRFGDSVEHRCRGLWRGAPPAKASAQRWVENLRADLGGTEMAEALLSTVAIPNEGPCDVMLITDGEIEGIDEVIDVAIKSAHRVFVVGIGASPAEVHLRRLAAATGGCCDFVAPGEDVEPAVLRMSARMHSARASNLRVEWPDALGLVWEQQPQGYAFENDVFNVAAFVKTPAERTAFKTAKLWGRLEDQPEEVLMGEAALSYTESSTNTLARLTAHAQYSELLGEKTQHLGTSQTANRQHLAVQYRLITDETNFVLVHERAEGEKAEEMPVAHKVAQMHPAGHSGVGSVSFSHAALPASPKPILFSIQDDSPFASQSLATPSVWRTNRTAAADRVNALLSVGQDDYEIPAFLRKQADGPNSDMPPVKPKTRQSIDKRNPMYWIPGEHATRSRKLLASAAGYVGITPAGLDHWLAINDPSFWPKSYAGLRDLGLGQAVIEWLEFEIGLDREDASVVEAFLGIVMELGLANTVGLKGAINALKHAVVPRQQAKTEGEIASEIRLALKDSKASAWPTHVAEFPEAYVA